MTGRVEKTSTPGGGTGGYAGYEYQVDVSVWLALHLLVVHRVARSVRIEPVSEEDLEADVEEEDAPGRLTSRADINEHTLVVQAKLRTANSWTESRLKKLLRHGGVRRKSAVERLKDEAARYLLVTNAQLEGPAARVGIADPVSAWPETLTPALAALGEGQLDGRVAVLSTLDRAKLSYMVREALTDSFRVPRRNWEACREALRAAVRARMTGEKHGVWTREEVEALVRGHEGYFASSPELETFVEPTNWGEITGTLKERRAVVIVGASGTGKTWAIRKLVDDLRGEVPGLERVVVGGNPRELHGDGTTPPVVYEIEDPWGRLAFDPTRREWNQQLQRFLETRLKGAVYLVGTSRLDVAASAGRALGGIEGWVVRLEAEHYGEAERQRIYALMTEGLPRRLQGIAGRASSEVLSKLATPLEIRKFFDALAEDDAETSERELIRVAIGKAHEEAIELNVAEQIEEREEVRAAAVVWGLLRVADVVPLRILTRIEEDLHARHADMARGVMSLVRFLIAGHSLRQGSDGDGVSYYHPRVEAGVERALLADGQRLIAREAVRRLAELLASEDAPDEGWAANAAAALVASARKVQGLAVELTPATQGTIDDWLRAYRPASEWDYQKHLELAAEAGSTDSAIAEIGRYLVEWQDYTRLWGFVPETAPPDREESWFERLRADRVTRPTIERYVREVLSSDHSCYFGRSFVDSVERLAPNLADAFIDAARRVVGHGVYGPADVIAAGAVRDLDGFEEVVDEAVAMMMSEERSDAADAWHLAIMNGEYNEDYADHVDFDEGFTADQFLGAYVQRARETGDWSRIAAHRHRSQLAGYWLSALLQLDRRRVDAEESTEAVRTGLTGSAEDRAWIVAARAWDERFRPRLEERIYAGHERSEVRRSALACMVTHVPEAVSPLVRRLREGGEYDRLVEIAADIAAWLEEEQPYSTPSDAAARQVRTRLPRDLEGVTDASLALLKGGQPVVSAEALELLRSATAGGIDVRRLRVSMAGYASLDVADDVRWLLAHAEDPSAGVEAVEEAVRQGMEAEVRSALDHHYAHVVAAAVQALGTASEAPLDEGLLAFREARGSPVRKALVAVLEAKPHIAHVQTLLALLRDEWSRFSDGYGYDDHFPIARSAMRALAQLAPLEDEAMRTVHQVVVATSDRALRADGLRLLARSDERRYRMDLLKQALRPGREEVRLAAVAALCEEAERVDADMLAPVDAAVLASLPPVVAATFACLVGARAAPETVLEIGQSLGTDGKRRALVLLLIRFVTARSVEVGRELGVVLGKGHPAVGWALGGEDGQGLGAEVLDDLGAIEVCEAVCRYMA